MASCAELLQAILEGREEEQPCSICGLPARVIFPRRGSAAPNLFALRATSPSTLLKADDPVGPENDVYLRWLGPGDGYHAVVAAWGVHGHINKRWLAVVRQLAERRVSLQCLELTDEGQPRHPLYLPKNATLRPYEPIKGKGL